MIWSRELFLSMMSKGWGVFDFGQIKMDTVIGWNRVFM